MKKERHASDQTAPNRSLYDSNLTSSRKPSLTTFSCFALVISLALFFFPLKIYLFIYFWLHWILVAARRLQGAWAL